MVAFHAAGAGGQSFESLADGTFVGVIDVSTTELVDELIGGIQGAGPDRLEAAGRAGLSPNARQYRLAALAVVVTIGA